MVSSTLGIPSPRDVLATSLNLYVVVRASPRTLYSRVLLPSTFLCTSFVPVVTVKMYAVISPFGSQGAYQYTSICMSYTPSKSNTAGGPGTREKCISIVI